MTPIFPTSTAAEFDAAATRACELLAAGEPVALPTETVYGLAADALRADAVVRIFEAKERPFFDPLIVHLPDLDWLERLADIPAESRALVDALIARFWPGPLTLVLPRRALVPDLVTSGLATVAVRMSAHPVFRAVIERFGKPLAAPSANRFGRISPTAADHVLAELGGRIPAIVDGGATEHGLESTIIAVEGGNLRILRAGPVTAEAIGDLLEERENYGNGWPVAVDVFANLERLGVISDGRPGGSEGAPIEAPGQMASHYAPRTPLSIIPGGVTDGRLSFRQQVTFHPSSREPRTGGLLAWCCEPAEHDCVRVEILSPAGDLREAAATLFAKLRRLDEAGLDVILAEPVPEYGLGIAIMDRLRKAAAKPGEAAIQNPAS